MKANGFAIILFTDIIIFRIFLTKIVNYIPDPIAIKVNIVVASSSSTRYKITDVPTCHYFRKDADDTAA